MSELRIGVVGAGLMGADHIVRIEKNLVGARVAAVIEPDETRATSAINQTESAQWYKSIEKAIDAGDLDAVVIATPGNYHEQVIMPLIDAEIPMLCEKPLSPDPESALRIIASEVKKNRKLIQVGFMRRFDEEYLNLRKLIESGDSGELLGLHCAHRNPSVPETYNNDMLIYDSIVHEIDIVRFLADSPIKSIQVRQMKRNHLSPRDLKEPILALLETESGVLATVEMNVSVQFGYQVKTEAVFQRGIAEIGRTHGMTTFSDARISNSEHMSFKTRFKGAFDLEFKRWIEAVRNRTIDGPSSWDGYLAAATVEAGLKARASGEIVEINYAQRPALYSS